MDKLKTLLAQSAAGHQNLCPRQVLGVRIGMLAGKVLNFDLPQTDKRLFAFVECDGCGMGGIAIASGCRVERRTMQVLDYGKLAATFVDTLTGQAVRIRPQPDCREQARRMLPELSDPWHAQLEAYQLMPDETLLMVEPVELKVSMEAILSQPGLRAICETCGEEISNRREVPHKGQTLCRACAGESYFASVSRPAGKPTRNRAFIPVITVIGKSGAGKTTLMEKLVRELSGRGYRVAAVKHHSHRGFEIDIPGKDSWRFARAGSRHVVIAAPDQIAAYRQLEHELSLDEITAGIEAVDLILVEGYRRSGKPSLEVVRSTNSLELIGSPEQRIAMVSDLPLEAGVPCFDLEGIRELVEFIEAGFLR